ncbi:MAG: PH domain-containing protein [Pseudohongiella sp.]|nr:PH domain-containing protein [Pseudohongiella sp.]MDP2285314.1 PH domain-containing protein [Pseudohongiella sp.]
MFRSNPLGFVLALLLVPVVIGLVIFLVWYLKCISTRLELVGNDLVLTEGLLSKERTELDITGIRTVKVYQSLLNRMLNVGTISVFTAGDDAEIVVSGLPDPHDLRELINRQQDS